MSNDRYDITDEVKILEGSVGNCYDNMVDGLNNRKDSPEFPLFVIAEAINNVAAGILLINKNAYNSK